MTCSIARRYHHDRDRPEPDLAGPGPGGQAVRHAHPRSLRRVNRRDVEAQAAAIQQTFAG